MKRIILSFALLTCAFTTKAATNPDKDLLEGICYGNLELVERALNNGVGVSVGYYEYEFLCEYIQFLINQNLIYYDFSDFLIDWEDRKLVPIFLCPLSPRGQEVVDILHYSYNARIFHERYLSIDQSMLPFPLDEIDNLLEKITS